jgi:hypothetical protein
LSSRSLVSGMGGLLGSLVDGAVGIVSVLPSTPCERCVWQSGAEMGCGHLEKICAGDEGHKIAFLIDYGQLALLGALHQLVGLRKSAALLGHNHIARHHVSDGQVIVADEVDVAGADDALQVAANLARVCDQDAREAPDLLDRTNVPTCTKRS